MIIIKRSKYYSTFFVAFVTLLVFPPDQSTKSRRGASRQFVRPTSGNCAPNAKDAGAALAHAPLNPKGIVSSPVAEGVKDEFRFLESPL